MAASTRVRTARRIVLPLAIALLAGAGCRGFHGTGAPTTRAAGRTISGDEIRAAGLSTAWDVLRRFAHHMTITESGTGQPVRANRRGRESIYLREEPLLILDGSAISDFRMLQNIPAQDIHFMRVLSAGEGSTMYGLRAASGVIMVQTLTN